MEPPATRYAKSGRVHIAYQVAGQGAPDLVLVPGIFTNIDYQWEEPSVAAFLRRLMSFSRLILFDPGARVCPIVRRSCRRWKSRWMT